MRSSFLICVQEASLRNSSWAFVLLTLVLSKLDLLIVQQFVEQCAEISKFGMLMMIVVRHRKFVLNLVVS